MAELSENALQVARKRYIREDLGESTWEDCCRRVAKAIASVEDKDKQEYWEERFFDMLFELKALSGGRVLRNAGTPSPKLLNCHVLPLDDSILDIGEFIKKALVLNAEGGGVGCFPKLRPIGAEIKTKGGNSSGLLSFLKAISVVLDTVESGGNRRCLPAWSLVFTKEGLVPIEDVKVGSLVFTKDGLKPIVNKFVQGEQLLYKIKTNAGNYYATGNHRVAVFNEVGDWYEWKEVSSLDTNDKLVGFDGVIAGKHTELPNDFTEERPLHSTTCRDITIPKLDTNIAWLIGLIHGNGFIGDKRVEIAINSDDKTTISRARRVLEKFGVKAQAKKRKGENCVGVVTHSVRLVEYMKKYIKTPNTPINIPDFILTGTVDIRSAYLAGIVDSDGSYKTHPIQLVSTVYPKFAEQIQSLYFSLGIPTRTRNTVRKDIGWKDLTAVTLIGFRKHYNKYVGFYSTKGNLPESQKANGGFSLPKDLVMNQLRCRDYDHKWTTSEPHIIYDTFIDCGGEAIGIPIDIKSIEEYGIAETYDIEVEDNHSFYADGILVHNSGMLPIIDVSHPEVIDVINAKLKLDELNNFNISIGVTNEFLDAVEQKKKWTLQFNGEEYKTLWARDIFDLIVENNLKSGEPGLVNVDNMKISNTWYFSPIESLNLCVTGDTKIELANGTSVPIKELADKNDDIDIFCLNEKDEVVISTMRNPRCTRKNVPIYKVTFDDGSTLKGTEDHKIDTLYDGFVELRNLKPGDRIKHITKYKLANTRAKKKTPYWFWNVGARFQKSEHRIVYKHYKGDIPENKDVNSMLKSAADSIGKMMNGSQLREYKRFLKIKDKTDLNVFFDNGIYVKKVCEYCGKPFVVRWNYRQQSYCSVQCGQHVKEREEKAREYWKNRISIVKDAQVNIFNKLKNRLKRDPLKKEWENECRHNKVSFRLHYNRDTQHFKSYKELKFCAETINTKVVKVEKIGYEDVYTGTVDKYHNYLCVTSESEDRKNLIKSMNCGELKLSKNQSCCLGSLVLPNFLRGTQTDWKKLEETINVLVRFLDDVLDANVYTFSDMRDASLSCRRLGIGVIGLGSFLLEKHIRYGSPESLDKVSGLIRFIRDKVYEASINLAKERGAFPGFNKWAYLNAKFVKKLPARIRLQIKEYGIRNATLQAFAPTGSISLITDTTSGVEPLPMKAYVRKDKVGERIYINPKYAEILESNSTVPDWCVDSLDLSPEEHFEMAVAIQSLNDGSISKTEILPANTKHSQLRDWLLEYSRQLVGITTYVDQSRSDQILRSLSVEKAREHIKQATNSLSEEDVKCARGTCDI